MPDQIDPEFLANEAYGDESKLSTRIHIQERYSTNPRNWFHWILDRLDLDGVSRSLGCWMPTSTCRILELGCGPGDLWQKNRSRLPDGWQIILSDLSAGMLESALCSLNATSPERFRFTVLDVQAIPFPGETFEVVIGNGLLDHIPDRVTALNEIQRVLKPGGRFYSSTGGRAHLQEIEDLVRPFLPDTDFGGDPHRFGLENGATLLSPWFEEIRLERYPDELVFKQAEPILAYVLSEALVSASLIGEKLLAFRQFVDLELAARGEIRVTSDKGLFTAVKPVLQQPSRPVPSHPFPG